jgi:CHAT domain-containing protein/Tfp pilus assembly protein PilF
MDSRSFSLSQSVFSGMILQFALVLYPVSLRGQNIAPGITPVSQSAASSQSETTFLEAAKPLERNLQGGEKHTYEIRAESGQFMHAVVVQLGIDVALTLFAPDGKPIGSMDSPNGTVGLEQISTIAEAPGVYRLDVVSGDKNAPVGRYRVTIEPIRSPSDHDRARIAAERVFFNAAQLEGQGSADSSKTAIQEYLKSLSLWRAAGDRYEEALTLDSMGTIDCSLDEMPKALDYFHQALPLWRDARDPAGEGNTRSNIGFVYSALGEKQKALDYYSQALPLLRAAGDRQDEAIVLSNIGVIYRDLGEKQKALDYYNQALPLMRAMGDRQGEARTLNNMGFVYRDLGEKHKALDYLQRTLPLERAVGDRAGEAATLNNIGVVYDDLGEKQKALDYLNEALPPTRDIGDRGGEAITLTHIGAIYDDLGEKQKALDYYTRSLPLSRAVQDPLGEAATLVRMMEYWKNLRSPSLAVLFGKQAIDRYQQVRRNIGGLEKETQQSFLKSKEDYYRELADLLISGGRIPEAQQVLDLLKEQEYSDYVRGKTGSMFSPLALTPAEQQAEEDYQKSTAQILSLGEQWAQLKKVNSRTAEQEKQYQQISEQLGAASKGLNDYYARLYVLFGKDSEANKQVADVKGDVSVLKQAIAKMPRTVALYTLVGHDRISVIVISGSATVAREYAIREVELNRKVAEFEQALRDPAKDAKRPAQELYKILIEPVKAELDQAQAETLVWSLDGVLRYVPIAALYDGNNYIVENYNTVTITPASIAHLVEKPEVSNLSVAAMGISRKYEDGLSALPAVEAELGDVVKDSRMPAAHGVLPGSILLNGAFTEKAMENELQGQHAVVHIASHFVFKPGDDSQSYLLLAGKEIGGNGFHLTVADFRDNQKLTLDDTDLLTLSACETGMSGNAGNGREVDGLGTTAQLKGARAVISSLWEVNDTSTGKLMADFYRRWVAGAGKVEKVEALRQAQMDLILGKIRPSSSESGRGFGLNSSKAPATFEHPYYWAPFVLMGNWR